VGGFSSVETARRLLAADNAALPLIVI